LPTAFLPFDEIFTDATTLLVNLARQLDLPLPEDFDPRVEAFRSDFLDAGLRHASFNPAQLDAAADILPAARAIHLALLETVASASPTPCPDTLKPWHDWLARSMPILHDHDRLHIIFHEHTQQIINFKDEVGGLKAHMALLEAQRDPRNKALEAEVDRLTHIVADIRQHLHSQTRQIEDLTLQCPDPQEFQHHMQRWVKTQNRLLLGSAADEELRIEETRTIQDSHLFDPEYYLTAYPDIRKAGVDPLDHFIRTGWKEGRNPSAAFDTARYTQHWLSRDWTDRNPLYHYLVEGKDKGCTPFDVVDSPPSARLVEGVRKSGLFDETFYREKYPDVKENGIDPVEHYFRSGWREGRNPSPRFDTRFYLRTYLYHDTSGTNPLQHYLDIGRKKGCHPTEESRVAAFRRYMDSPWHRIRRRISHGVDRYRTLFAPHRGFVPTVGHITRKVLADGLSGIPSNIKAVRTSAKARIREMDRLATLAASADNPDNITLTGMDRASLPSSGTIVFIGCDAKRAGSQVLLLNILQWLHTHTSLQIKTLLPQGGALVDEYARYGPVFIWDDLTRETPDPDERRARLRQRLGPFDLVYGNTYLAATLYPELLGADVPFLSHIHELEGSIQAYGDPKTVEVLHRLTTQYIACSPQVARNLLDNHPVEPDRLQTVNAFIRHRDKVDTDTKKRIRRRLGIPDNTCIVVGCGTIYWRKGPDLFVQTAARLKRLHGPRFRFLWIGEDFWDDDPASVRIAPWKDIEAFIRENDLEGQLAFFGEKSDALDHILAADVFYLPSREDPFPLVCLEAAQGGVPVVCFDKAGGMPDFIHDDAGIVVPFLDIEAAAEAINHLRIDKNLRQRLGTTASEKLARQHTDTVALPRILDICRNLMRKPPPVTVIVPVYNHAPFLRQRLDGILGQSFQDFEVIILDDASTDDSFDIAHTYTDDPRVRLIRNNANTGSPFRQWQKGIELAQGEILWIAEGDDDCHPDFLRELLPFFRDPDVALAYADSTLVDEQDRHLGTYQAYYESLDISHWKMDWLLPGPAEVDMGLGVKNTIPNASAVLLRKQHVRPDMLDRIADMRFSGDWYLYVQLARHHRIAFRSKALNIHRKHTATLTHQFNNEDGHRQTLLDEAKQIHDFVIRHFPLSPAYRPKLAHYLAEQIGTRLPDLQPGEQENRYPVAQTLAAVDQRIQTSRSITRRLAFITTGDTDHDGGSEQLWIQTALRMAHEGHPVIVIIRHWTPEPYFFDTFRQAGITLAFKEDDPRQALATFQPDLVVVNIGDQDEGTPWYDTCRQLQLPYVILNHLTKEPRYWPVNPQLQEAVVTGNRLARQVFFTSRNNRRLMEKRLGTHIPHASLFHNPLFLQRDLQLPFPPLDGPIRLAMPSRLLTIHKGQHVALQVFSWKKWRRRNIQLHIYGKGPDEASLRDTAAQEKLHNVFFHEPQWQLPNPDMAAVWRDNHALLMTSFMEGMPLVLLNAMFHARIPIVTDIGGHREVVEDNHSGFIAAEPTAQAVDEALERAWHNRHAWPAIGLEAKGRMLQFAPEDPVADLVAKLLHLTGN